MNRQAKRRREEAIWVYPDRKTRRDEWHTCRAGGEPSARRRSELRAKHRVDRLLTTFR